MPLSWNEIRHRAIAFAKSWEGVSSEKSEKQTFWNEFFQVFGHERRVVATFEAPVQSIKGTYGFIDLFWPRNLIVEHKSLGGNLGTAESQAFRYLQDLVAQGREKELPRYIIVSDFARIAVHDLEPEDQLDLPRFDRRRTVSHVFPLSELHKHIKSFAFMAGYKQHTFKEQDPINIEASEILGHLHDALEEDGYRGTDLERLLVRILFCLFAEDTGIFNPESFKLYLLNRTGADGSDLGSRLTHLFEVLNTDPSKRQKSLDEELAAFPYVNGELFADPLKFPTFTGRMREALLECCDFEWSAISPAIFGSLFQSVMEPKERRQIGAHYTSERDILKVVRSLFLDELREEFEAIKQDRSNRRLSRLEEFQKKLSGLNFLDPACGCGNFLVITYRELRQLELETLQLLHTTGQQELDVRNLSKVDVHQFYGIELGEWPARIAEVAMWLMDHQMNVKQSTAFGQWIARIPLKKSPHITQGNALRIDWNTVLPKEQCSYVLGNPPFIGKHLMSGAQAEDMELVWGNTKGIGVLDYVTGWYCKAANYIKGTRIAVGFVSTNSISQGEQVGILWEPLFQKHGIKIHFAHRTFAWSSEARGKAHVHVVIIGFGAFDPVKKHLFDYDGDKVTTIMVKNISPYLVEGSDVAALARSSPLSPLVPDLVFGSKATDGGNLIFEPGEASKFIKDWPAAKKFVRPYISADDFLNGIERHCLWLVDAQPEELREIAGIKERIAGVRDFRMASKKEQTREKSFEPTVFAEIRQPRKKFLAIPKTSSENRPYIPMEFRQPTTIVASEIYFCEGATNFHFGILSSKFHMAWMRQVCGRLKSDYRYSNKLVYNNFPWPENPSEKQRAAVEAKAQAVLDARAQFPEATLADLYDPLAMPPLLAKAHAELDRAVELCYRPQPFASDRERVEYLFALYEKLTAPLVALAAQKPKRKRG